MFRYALTAIVGLALFSVADVKSAQAQYGLSYNPNCVRPSAYSPYAGYRTSAFRSTAYVPYVARQTYYAPGIAVGTTAYYGPGVRTYVPTPVTAYGVGYGTIGYPAYRPVRPAPRYQLRIGF